MNILFNIIDYSTFGVLTVFVAYLVIFTLFSFKKQKHSIKNKKQHRFLIIIPAYKEENVIEETTLHALNQDYPKNLYCVVVVSDQMEGNTIKSLINIGAKVIEVHFVKSTKGKSINYALQQISENYDGLVILDADNLISPTFLTEINNSWSHNSTNAIQAHRSAKNLDTPISYLDAVSEEINNTIFRKGHIAIGLSSALIGSGMAIDFTWMKCNSQNLASTVEDKEIELLLLKENIKIQYLENTIVLDEKIRTEKAFNTQRRRWMSGNMMWIPNISLFIKSILLLKIDLADKLFQWIMPPRLILMGILLFICVIFSAINIENAVKWLSLTTLLFITLFIAIPRRLRTKKLAQAILRLPILFFMMATNYFKKDHYKNTEFKSTNHG